MLRPMDLPQLVRDLVSVYKIEFHSLPPESFFPSNVHFSPSRPSTLPRAVQNLLLPGMIVPIPKPEWFRDFTPICSWSPRRKGFT